jgi:DNA-binding GntR family transcriptional regulator
MPQTLERRPEPPSTIAVAKVKRGTPLYEQIYDALWNLIFNGEISPGQRLSDREWAQRLDTSRTPVREAMRQMARDGVLLALENGGYQVRPVDPQGLSNLYKCRASLAALAVHDTTLAGNDRLFKQIKTVVESTGKAIAESDAAAALKFNSKFHNLVVESCGNPHLVIIMANLEKLILFYRIALLKTSAGDREHSEDYFEHLARGNERQVQIADMMAQRNAKQAGHLMEQHLLASADDMARLLQPS